MRGSTLHPLHQQLEVAGRQVQIHVQLAQIVEVLQAHRLQAGVEGLDDARPHLAAAAIGAPHHAQIGQAAGVFLEDGRGSSVDPSSTTIHSRGWHRLRRHAVERAAEVLGLVPARRDKQGSVAKGSRGNVTCGDRCNPVGLRPSRYLKLKDNAL